MKALKVNQYEAKTKLTSYEWIKNVSSYYFVDADVTKNS